MYPLCRARPKNFGRRIPWTDLRARQAYVRPVDEEGGVRWREQAAKATGKNRKELREAK